MSDRSSRLFAGSRLIDHLDGSVVLEVRAMEGQQSVRYQIHLAPHVAQDIGFQFYQRFSKLPVKWHGNQKQIA